MTNTIVCSMNANQNWRRNYKMKVDINNVNEVAQDVVGQQLVNDASEVGYSVSERIQLLIKQSQALSEELAQLIEQAGNDTSILLGQEVSSKVKSYAENKGIDLPDPDKKKELDDFDREK